MNESQQSISNTWLPVCPVRGSVIYPSMVMPIDAGRAISVNAINAALDADRTILIVTQKDKDTDLPTPNDLHTMGTLCNVLRARKNSDGSVQILVQAISRATIHGCELWQQGEHQYLRAMGVEMESKLSKSTEIKALYNEVHHRFAQLVEDGKTFPTEISQYVLNLEDPSALADAIAFHMEFSVEDKQVVLETLSIKERLRKVAVLLDGEADLLQTQRRIQAQVREEADKNQREFFLREQMKAIQKELNGEDGDLELEEFKQKIQALQLPEAVSKEVDRELNRFARMHPDSAEASVVRTYLDWIVALPWSQRTQDHLDLKASLEILDQDHFGLEQVKDRIMEYLAVRQLRMQTAKRNNTQESSKGPILLFVGPPGVGKTSIAKSIAKSLGRKYQRIALGGARDDSDIRGHRRTYIGSMPGRIIQALRQAGSKNPVILLDEIDKLGSSQQGDPSSSLLELLDPAQNKEFTDHYLGVPFDVSEVLFICTANFPGQIAGPLIDRMEQIEFTSYIEQEKLQIAKQYIVPRQLEENGLKASQAVLSDATLSKLVTYYTREAGVRNLEREIGTVLRKVARKIAQDGKKRIRVLEKDLEGYLGAPKHIPESEAAKPAVGVATGMFYTPVGGDIMFIEVLPMSGKGGLVLTGQLGDVMKESARAAMSYIKHHAQQLAIDPAHLDNTDLHLHVPAGAIPKEGPSAGVGIVSAMVSALRGVPLRHDVSMTGEITLTGKVLPIGGVKEKVLGARRAGIREVILPLANKADLNDIPAYLRQDMTFHCLSTIDEVLSIMLP